jgi:hypothetical protein
MNQPIAIIVHALERRVRLRAPALAGRRDACERAAQRLAEDPCCELVEINPHTGSVLIQRSEGRLDPEALRATLERLVSDERDDAGRPLTSLISPECEPGPTRVARAVAHAVAGINADVRVALDNRADLGTLLPFFFATAGAAEVVVTRKLPAPAWFNLFWWSIRSFMTFNPSAVTEEKRV